MMFGVRNFANPAAGLAECYRVLRPEGEVTIAVVGKYTGLLDAYKSLAEALNWPDAGAD